MNLWRINVWKEWRLQREFLVDALLVALVGVTVFPGDAPLGFAVMGILLAASLGVRVGGDEAMNDAWEFVLTRPIDRGEWIRVRYLLGFLPVAMLLCLVVVSDLVETHAWFARLVAEPLVAGVEFRFAASQYPPVLALVLLAYSLCFSFASREERPENVRQHGPSGVIAALVVGFAVAVLTVIVVRLVAPPGSTPEDLSGVPFGPETIAFTAIIFCLAWSSYRVARSGLIERELVPAGGSAGLVRRRGASAGVALAILVIVLLGAFVLYLLLRSPTAVEPATFEIK